MVQVQTQDSCISYMENPPQYQHNLLSLCVRQERIKRKYPFVAAYLTQFGYRKLVQYSYDHFP
ncbi:hypothetical protein SDC9_180454 [bioreactor metagenome]|uniref:Uncharacterized protein n=1 Tax=bioreactor metagenome TaxID=1076179 RepID=A0A645H1S5_9ZZZZ